VLSLAQLQFRLRSTHAHRDISVAQDILKGWNTYVTY
jgi:hypothetical protein